MTSLVHLVLVSTCSPRPINTKPDPMQIKTRNTFTIQTFYYLLENYIFSSKKTWIWICFSFDICKSDLVQNTEIFQCCIHRRICRLHFFYSRGKERYTLHPSKRYGFPDVDWFFSYLVISGEYWSLKQQNQYQELSCKKLFNIQQRS